MVSREDVKFREKERERPAAVEFSYRVWFLVTLLVPLVVVEVYATEIRTAT
jgi:hypothetical protein